MSKCRDEFLSSLSNGDYAPTTIRFYEVQTALIENVIKEIGIEHDPSTLTDDDVRQIVAECRRRFAVSTQRDYIIALKRMCTFSGNYVFMRVQVKYPVDIRPNVDWLTYSQAMTLLNHTFKTPLQEIVVTLELLHGFRRCECVRLLLDDVHDGYLTVRGKGRAGGKLRSVPMHPDFKRSYERWMECRNEMLMQCDSLIGQPRNVLVYLKGGKLHAYEQIKAKAIDCNLQEVRNRCDFDFSNHTLRRTFGRELFRSGVSIEIIATLYGHESTSQTMEYLGLNLDDMTKAMDIFKLKRE